MKILIVSELRISLMASISIFSWFGYIKCRSWVQI